jgi:hypothetical protein
MMTEDKAMPEKTVKVKVNAPFRVVHPDTGEAHTDGDQLSVGETVAQEWERSGWVERVK